MTDRIIYVLCYDDTSEEQAIRLFSQYEWARIYRIPADSQSHLFEGVMYQSELMKVYDEWKDKKYVGTIAYNFWNKVNPRDKNKNSYTSECLRILHTKILTPMSYDFVGFMPFSSPNFHHHNPNLRILFEYLTNRLLPRAPLRFGLGTTTIIDKLAFCFYNYWMTTPANMLRYIVFFNTKWLPMLESHPLVWENADYTSGKVSPEKLLELSRGRCNYYSLHPFANERLPNMYFRSINAKMLL